MSAHNILMCCVFSSESRNSNKYTQYTIFNIKNTLKYPKSAAMRYFPRDLKRVRNSRGKRAISVPATEVLLYYCFILVVPIWYCLLPINTDNMKVTIDSLQRKLK